MRFVTAVVRNDRDQTSDSAGDPLGSVDAEPAAEHASRRT